MSRKEHIHKLISKASRKIGLLYNMKDKLSRYAKAKYYTTFIRPVLEYGVVVYDNCTAFESNSIELGLPDSALVPTNEPPLIYFDEVGWDSLSNRRKNAKLVLMYSCSNSHRFT